VCTQKWGLELQFSTLISILRFMVRGCVIFWHFLDHEHVWTITCGYSKARSWAAGSKLILVSILRYMARGCVILGHFLDHKHVWTITYVYSIVTSWAAGFKIDIYILRSMSRGCVIFGHFLDNKHVNHSLWVFKSEVLTCRFQTQLLFFDLHREVAWFLDFLGY